MKRLTAVLVMLMIAGVAAPQTRRTKPQAKGQDAPVVEPPSKLDEIKAHQRFFVLPTDIQPPLEVKRLTVKKAKAGAHEAYLVIQNTGDKPIAGVLLNIMWPFAGRKIGVRGITFSFKPAAAPSSEGVSKVILSKDDGVVLGEQDCYEYVFLTHELIRKTGADEHSFFPRTYEDKLLYLLVYSVIFGDGTRWDTETAK